MNTQRVAQLHFSLDPTLRQIGSNVFWCQHVRKRSDAASKDISENGAESSRAVDLAAYVTAS